jgi:hypothetical protein
MVRCLDCMEKIGPDDDLERCEVVFESSSGKVGQPFKANFHEECAP